MARGILVPWPGIEPKSPVLEVLSLNHWTTGEVPVSFWMSYIDGLTPFYPVTDLGLDPQLITSALPCQISKENHSYRQKEPNSGCMTCLWQLALQSFWIAINLANHSDKPQAQIWPGVAATFMHCLVLPSMKSLLSQLLGVLGVTTLSSLPLRGLPQVQRATRPKGSVPDDFLRWFLSRAQCTNIHFPPFEPSWGQLWRTIPAPKLLVGQPKLLLSPHHSSASSSAHSFPLPLLSPGVDLKSTAQEVSCLHALSQSQLS